MDPAALGTTIIGLENIRRDDARDGQAVVHRDRPQPRRGFVRRRLADTLRRTAERIAPTPSPAA